MTQYLMYDELSRHGHGPARKKKEEELRIKLEQDVKALTNEQLLDDYSSMQGGDDWDGCMTPGGKVALEVLDWELCSRLVSCGFLENKA